jgi:sulfoxide reductase heme-binding subunit YedZ
MIAAVTWYVTRGSGAVALVFLSAALVLGIPTMRSSNTPYAPRVIVQLLHRNASLLAVLFVIVHVITTVTDPFVDIGVVAAVVPFVGSYRPLWLGLGAVAFDVMLAIVATSLVRARLSYRSWRYVHLSAYACWPIAVIHGLGTGSDTGFTWMRALDVACAAAVLGAIGWRLWAPAPTPATAPASGGAPTTVRR